MSYSADYFKKIYDALSATTVTDKNGEKIAFDSALQIWTENNRAVQHKKRGFIFFCGNGASASMAEHMSHDYFQNAKINTMTCSEVSHITAIGNDIGYENVFSYRAKRMLSENDMLVAISSSGNSPNIVKAIEAADANGAFIVTLSGMKPDNKIRKMGQINFYVPLLTYGEVESVHAVLLHCALDHFLDTFMGGRH